jgi:hypothetical protein
LSAEPRIWSDSWEGRPGFRGAALIRQVKRPDSTARTYGVKVDLWIRFNAEGDGLRPYDVLEATADKFDLFAGWLLGDADLGIPGGSTDKDLNGFRSAINRFLADRGQGRPLRDDPEITRTIKVYRALMIQSHQARGVDTDLHRVPCPEPVFLFLVELGESRLASNETLFWVGVFILQLFGWLRGDSVHGFQPGDVVLSPAGWLLLSIRRMKGRPEFVQQPGLVSIPPAPAGHPRARLVAIIRRCFDLDPTWYCVLARADLSDISVKPGESAAAMFLTRRLRALTAPMAAHLPRGAVVGSHSWREMAAVACYQAKFDTLRMACHGFWRDPATMWSSYIRPYKDSFPFCRFLAGVMDFLRAV